jgi:hypothetical protein
MGWRMKGDIGATSEFLMKSGGSHSCKGSRGDEGICEWLREGGLGEEVEWVDSGIGVEGDDGGLNGVWI